MKSYFFTLIAACTAVFAAENQEVILLGGGIGSLTSAIYLSRAGLKPVVLEGPSPGGLIIQSHSVQNWPGEMEISGTKLADKVRAQAKANGASLLLEEVVAVDFSKRPFEITSRGVGEKITQKRLSDTVIIAMGTKPNLLGVPGEDTYWGKGISNCATCDGSLYRGKRVAVVGGGDAAVVEALYLSNIAKEVTVFVRKNAFKGIEETRLQTLQKKKNVTIVLQSAVVEVLGTSDLLTGVKIKTVGKPDYIFPIDGLFLAVGSTPNSDLFKGILELDAQGYIVVKNGQETSIPGVYAIGDIVDPVYKQAITAAGDGAKAALQAERFMSDK